MALAQERQGQGPPDQHSLSGPCTVELSVLATRLWRPGTPSCWPPSFSPEGQNSEFWPLSSDPGQSPPSRGPIPPPGSPLPQLSSSRTGKAAHGPGFLS